MYRFRRAKLPVVASTNENKYRKTINEITHLISVKSHVFFRIFGTFYMLNNLWRWKTIKRNSTRLLFLPLINSTSCDFCCLPFFYFELFPGQSFYFVPLLLLFLLFKFFSLPLCLFFSFTLAYVIFSYLSDVITEGECSINCFRSCLVFCFSGQTSKIFVQPEKQNLCY